MKFTERDITPQELDSIYEDFRRIEQRDGVPPQESVRFQLIAEEGDKVVGYVSGLTEHKWFYLTDLWVEESRRRQGLGSRLLKDMEEKALSAGCTHIYLWTAGNVNPHFYRKNGYECFTVLENKFGVEGYHQYGFKKALRC